MLGHSSISERGLSGLSAAAAAAALDWLPQYPGLFVRVPRRQQQAGLAFVPEPAQLASGSWWPAYPDRLPGPGPRQQAGAAQTFDPAESLTPAVPPLCWLATYPDQHLRVKPRQDGWSVWVLEPSLLGPPPAMSWRGEYPDLHLRVPRRQGESVMGPLEPSLFTAPPGPPFDPAQAVLPAQYGAPPRRPQQQRQAAEVLEPSLLNPPPPLSWAPRFPDAVPPARKARPWDAGPQAIFQPPPAQASALEWYVAHPGPRRPAAPRQAAGAIFVDLAGFRPCPGAHARPDQAADAHGRIDQGCCPAPRPVW